MPLRGPAPKKFKKFEPTCLNAADGVVLMTKEELENVRQKCDQALNKIIWRDNTIYAADVTLVQAIEAAEVGLDSGRRGALQVMPVSIAHMDWMNYARLLTLWYNRDHDYKYFTILRIKCYT